MPHTPACRARIVDELMKTPDGAARVARMIERQNRFLTEQVAKGDVRVQGAEASVAADVPPRSDAPGVVPEPVRELPSLRPMRRTPDHVEMRPEAPAECDTAEDEHVPENRQEEASSEMELGMITTDVKPTDCSIPDSRTLDERLRADLDVRDIGRLYAVAEREAGRERVERTSVLIHALGGDGKTYKREKARTARKIIAEIYSAPRVTAAAQRLPQYGIAAGLALDLTVDDETGKPYDFSDPKQRAKADKLFQEQQPFLLVGSPPCTPFSQIQAINPARRDPREIERELIAGRVHLEFCCSLYRKQIARGAYFLHEHPQGATSWREPCMQAMLQLSGVRRVRCDQCQFGQESETGNPVRKATGFMSNAWHLLDIINRRCFGRKGFCTRPQGGRHQDCLGKVARRAAIYSDEMCEAILSGMKAQLVSDRRARDGEIGVHCVMDDGDDEVAKVMNYAGGARRGPVSDLLHIKPDNDGENRKPDGNVITPDRRPHEDLDPSRRRSKINEAILNMNRHERFVDDLTGLPLDPDLCRAARRKELDYFESKHVWVLKKVSECRSRTGRPPITVRWVETNKGDDQCPNIRSRLVAREMRLPGEEAVFAPTPPLETLRMVLSHAVTDFEGEAKKVYDPKSEHRQQVLLIDISRAYFNAPTSDDKPTYVELPPDLGAAPDMCGLLKRHMYGTKRAAEGWQEEYSQALAEMGFRQGSAVGSCCPSTGTISRLPGRNSS